jgi:hypothetical protein
VRTRASLLLVVLAAAFAPAPARAEPQPAGRVVMVLVDRVRVDDFLGIPAVRNLAPTAAFGLISVAGRGVVTPFVGSLSISAGTRAVAPDPATHFLTIQPGPVRERLLVGTVGEAYQARTGMVPPEASGETAPFVYPDITAVKDANGAAEIRAVPGMLGQTLADAAVTRSVASFADPVVTRLAPLVAMDRRGVVPWGILMNRLDPSAAGAAIQRAMDRGGLVAIDAGGTASATVILPEVIKRVGPNDALIILASDPAPEVSFEHTWLAPILAIGPGLDGGLLTSASTRRDGVVSNVDVMPTVLSWLGVTPPEGVLGQPFESIPVGDPPAETQLAFDVYARLAAQRGDVFRAVSALAILAMVAAAGFVLRRRTGRAPAPFAVRALLLGAASTPLAMLVEPLLGSRRLGVTVLAVLGGGLVIGAAAAAAFERDRSAFAAVAGATLLLLLADVLIGSPLAARSLLGYTVAGGTRFYGLASEEMGVALAGLFLTLGFVVDARPRWRRPAYAAAAMAVLIFSAPPFGAKFGMLLTAIPALAVAWTVFEGRRLTRETVLLAAAVLIAGIGMATLAGLLAGSGGSHIGAETRVLGQEGAGAAISVLLRRAGVALRLLITFWAWLVAAGVAIMLFAAVPRRERLARVVAGRPGLHGAITGLAVAAGAALLFNDAGAVIVATMVLVAGPAVMAELAAPAQPGARPSSTRRRSSTSATRSPSMIGAIT